MRTCTPLSSGFLCAEDRHCLQLQLFTYQAPPPAGATSASLLRCALAANIASSGGAAATFGPVALELQSCALQNNTAGADGGALLLSEGAAVAIAGSVLANNSAAAYGAALLLTPPLNAALLNNVSSCTRTLHVCFYLYFIFTRDSASIHILPITDAVSIAALFC